MDRIKEEWAAFKALSGKKKLEHILIYYKWHILVTIALIALLVSLVGTVLENRKEVLISGIFINNSTSAQGYAYLGEDYWLHCGADDNQKVEVTTGRTIHFDAQPFSQEDAAAFMIVSSRVAARTLDYIITDRASLKEFDEQEIVMDLRELLPEQTLARWNPIEQDGRVIALGLEDTAFARDYSLYAPDSCILIVVNAQNRENVVRFLEYLMK